MLSFFCMRHVQASFSLNKGQREVWVSNEGGCYCSGGVYDVVCCNRCYVSEQNGRWAANLARL